MSKQTIGFGLATALLTPPTAAAMPPPVGVSVVVLSEDAEAQSIGEAFVTILHERGGFHRPAHPIPRTDFWECIRKRDGAEACVRQSSHWKNNGAAVVVLVTGTMEQQWKCIGVAAAPKFAEAQSIQIDIKEGMFGSTQEQVAARNKAGSCIMAAGSESGW